MTVTSFSFFIFLIIGVGLYYIVPKKIQWIILLLLSIIFYVSAVTPYTIAFLAASTLIAYSSAIYIDKNAQNEIAKKSVTAVAITAVILNIVIWFLLKGSSFWILGSKLLNNFIPSFPVLSAIPLAGAMGMGYYTAQVIGYIMDVYWGNSKPQRNILKLFLFVSFFPQLTVGPISRYSQLESLFEKHNFSYKNLCYGCQRIIWGLFKKLVISDRVGIIINGIWADTENFNGIWIWIAVLLYPLQIYTDFSGCMDIVLGVAELFDIKLAENFKNPFFSRNSQEFWQRWHITLGNWARDYVFYPLLKSKWLVNFGKTCKKKFGKRWGKFIPWSIAMAVLWFVMGFWHGSVQHIFGVSLWFWTMLFLSELFAPALEKMIEVLKIDTKCFSWHLFQSVRTYLVYALGVVFFSASGLMQAFKHYEILFESFKHLNPWILFDGSIVNLGVTLKDVNVLIFGVIVLLFGDVLREKYGYARDWLSKQNLPFRWLIWVGLFVTVLVFGMYGPLYDSSAFIYQNF